MSISRRSIIKGASSLTLLSALPFAALKIPTAWSADPRIRPNLSSDAGKEMVEKYAVAVKAMKAKSADGPFNSWIFQWYTHWVRGDSSKAAQLDAIYGPDPSPARDLAVLMWDTCQAHGGDMWQPNFLPWHRAFVFYLEAIVQDILKDETFALPYWDYTNDPVLPEAFRNEGDPVLGSLYQPNRNPNINAGLPFNMPPAYADLDILKQADFLPGPGGVPSGFNQGLDFGLHGYIHTSVGDDTNMGAVPFAANDPIFWLHHCNIDRIWAAWNANGGANPTTDTWLGATHTFASSTGERTEVTNSQMSSTETLNYTYDVLPVTPAPATEPKSLVLSQVDFSTRTDRLAASEGSIRLGNGPTELTLNPNNANKSMSLLGTSNPTTSQVYLVLKDVSTQIQPGVPYDVYARLQGSTLDQATSGILIGSINFFSSQTLGVGTNKQVDFVFNVTAILSGNTTIDPLSIFVVTQGTPASGSEAFIGIVELVER